MTAFTAQHVTQSHSILLPATPQQLFPLFEPLGEKLWAEGWEPEILYPQSGSAQVGAVFATHEANAPGKIWTITAYEKEKTHVSYFNVLPSSHASWIDVRCEKSEGPASLVHITYTLTALTPQGNDYLKTFTQEYYQAYITSWQEAIIHYLRHQQVFSHDT